jgi:UDP-N-acetylglucosamine--N-acetylmuramyl-(pentapeptide) pyrophosphoryl-undecaprenol N-acetylglucosamine transferase
MTVLNGKIIFAGGGTGGHVYPALATIEALKTVGNFEILYIGGYQGIENSIIPHTDIQFKTIWISGFHRYFTFKNLIFPVKLIVSLVQSIFIIKQFKPNVVVGTGGYVSGPILYISYIFGIPTLIQEQDTYPGVTTRLLAKYVDYICVPFGGIESEFKKIKERIIVTGNPVRKSLEMQEKSVAVKHWGFNPDKPVLFIFGGSQGAQAINNIMLSVIPKLQVEYKLQVLWQTGIKNYDLIIDSELAKENSVIIKAYIEEMDLAYSVADIIISRAGAVSLAELSFVEKPCILVPYPYAAANHQEKNARIIAEGGAAVVVREGENFEEEILQAINNILLNQDLKIKMSKNWKKFQFPDAASNIASKILEMIRV